MFKKDDIVIYSGYGLCRVMDVTTMNMHGIPKDKLYYTLLQLTGSGGTIYTPVEHKEKILRAVISREEAEDLIQFIPEIEVLWVTDERLRENQYKEALKSCDCRDWIRIIKCLHFRRQDRQAQGKRMTAVDEKYFQIARDCLYSELSMSMGVPKERMEAFIMEQIEGAEVPIS